MRADTLTKSFLTQVHERPEAVALRWQNPDDTWTDSTWRAHAERVACAVSGLAALGVGAGDRVLLLTRNIEEFFVLDTAALFLRAAAVSLPHTAPAAEIAELGTHCRASVVVVEHDPSAALEAATSMPQLRHVVVIGAHGAGDAGAAIPVTSFADLLDREPADLDRLAAHVEPADLATVIYTSGTTGRPKGVAMDHHYLLWLSDLQVQVMGDPTGWRMVSYLPMSHIGERMTTHYLHVYAGTEVWCCPDITSIFDVLPVARPQYLFGVPRLWDTQRSRVLAHVAGLAPAERERFEAAMVLGRRVAELRQAGADIPGELGDAHRTADEELLAPVRTMLGFDELHTPGCGSAPIDPDILWFFHALGVPVAQGYGTTEPPSIIALSFGAAARIGTAGRPTPGVEVQLDDDGEILVGGDFPFLGYLDDPEATAALRDPDGWIHTGDLGEIDHDGYLSIVGRKKELIITSAGENVSPVPIERALSEHPLLAQACVVGDGHKHLVALLTLDPVVAPLWAADHGTDARDLDALAADPLVLSEVEAAVTHANERLPRPHRIRGYRLLADEWTAETGMLNATHKLQRRAVSARYADVIESIYAASAETPVGA